MSQKHNQTASTHNTITTTDVVIIGCGPVGLMAIAHAGMLGLKTISIDSMSKVGGQCTALYPEKKIYDIPGIPAITGAKLIANLKKQTAPFNPEIILKTKVVSVKTTDPGLLQIELSNGKYLIARAVVVASGKGSFIPNRPAIPNIELFEGKSIFYSVKNKGSFRDKIVAIAGGGDSAIDWAISLSEITKKLFLIHRRENFRCAPKSRENLDYIIKTGKIELVTNSTLLGIEGEHGMVKSIQIRNIKDGKESFVKVENLLLFFGLSSDSKFLDELQIKTEYGKADVNPFTMETSRNHIFAIGDVATYQNKLPLILSGFSEGATAMREIHKRLYPGRAELFLHSSDMPGLFEKHPRT